MILLDVLCGVIRWQDDVEGMRYFSGASTPLSGSHIAGSKDDQLKLSNPNWRSLPKVHGDGIYPDINTVRVR